MMAHYHDGASGDRLVPAHEPVGGRMQGPRQAGGWVFSLNFRAGDPCGPWRRQRLLVVNMACMRACEPARGVERREPPCNHLGTPWKSLVSIRFSLDGAPSKKDSRTAVRESPPDRRPNRSFLAAFQLLLGGATACCRPRAPFSRLPSSRRPRYPKLQSGWDLQWGSARYATTSYRLSSHRHRLHHPNHSFRRLRRASGV